MEVREPRVKYLTPQFKRTEAGDIPIDWIDKPIGEMAEVTSGGTPSRQVAAFWDGDIPWVTTAELDGGQVTETSQHITAAGLQYSAAKWLPAGTLLIALYGQGKTRGKCAVLRIAATTNQACAGIKLKEGVESDFVRHNLAHRYDYIRSLSNGGSQENLSGEIVKKIRVGMPSTRAEQRAISDALNDADALIDSLEQLLTKKRQIKQGAMQELLTGKRRLPGFNGEWFTFELRQLGHVVRGVSYNPDADLADRDTERTVRLLRSNNVQGGEIVRIGLQFVDHRRVRNDQYLQDGDLLLCMANGSRDLVGKTGRFVRADEFRYTFGAFMACFRPDPSSVDPAFVAFLFQSNAFRQHVDLLLAGSSINNLRPEGVLGFFASIPTEPMEQAALAQALAEMDAEIFALESRLTKAHALKQAMAQALLTGRIRLVEPAA